MSIIPLRRDMPSRTEIEEDPGPTGETTITIGDDGLMEIEIGGSSPQAAKPTPEGGDFDRNLAEDLDDMALSALASYLIEGIEADIEARREWEDTANMTAAYLGIKLTDPVSSPAADGTVSQAVVTTMLETGIKMWGTGRAELLPVGGPVKVQRVEIPPAQSQGIAPVDPSQDPESGQDAVGDDLADALERDMNWYLTKGDKGYYPDTSKMIIQRYWIGVGFKEVYRCPIERKPISRFVMAQDLIVQGNPPHLGALGFRVTKRTRVNQSTMRRLQARGHYLNVTLAHPTGITSNTEIVIGQTEGVTPTPTLPRDFDHTVYESCCELGSGTAHDLIGSLALLDQDETGEEPGYPLPYHVSIDVDSRTVLAIRRHWKEGDEEHKPRRRFVKFGFIPAFGFYDWGLIHLVGNPTQAATMLQRSTVDASLFANFPAWAVSQQAASRLENTVFRPGPGEVVRIPGTGMQKLSDGLMAWPYKEPSAAAQAMGQKLEGDIRKIGGVIEIPVGEGRIGNTPVGTIMSYIEAVSQVPGAVHKDDHIAQQEEFELLRELLAEDPEVLYRGNKSPARRWQTAEELLQPDLIPRADPNTPSQIHRLTKIQGMVQMGGLPQFLQDEDGPIANNREIYTRAMEVLSGDDAKRYTYPKRPPQAAPPPPPDPRIVAAQIKAQSQSEQTAGQIQKDTLDHQARLAEIAAEGDQKELDRESDERKTAVQTSSDHANATADRAHEAEQGLSDRAQAHTQHLNELGLEQTKLAQPAPPKPEGDVNVE